MDCGGGLGYLATGYRTAERMQRDIPSCLARSGRSSMPLVRVLPGKSRRNRSWISSEGWYGRWFDLGVLIGAFEIAFQKFACSGCRGQGA